MKKLVYLSALSVIILASCSEAFKKGDKGLEYKIIHNGTDQQLKAGDYMEIQVKQIYNGTKDTVLSDTRDGMPIFTLFDSLSTPPAYFTIMKQLKKGDSVIIRVLSDTLFKDRMNEMPKYMQKGKYRTTTIKLVNIFASKEQADSVGEAEAKLAKPRLLQKDREEIEKQVITPNKAKIESDSKIIEAYLAKNNIKFTKTKWGVYIATQVEGTGDNITMDDVASVYYTGKILGSDSAFDSNMDPAMKKPALPVALFQYRVIMGWIDGLQQMKKGTKATLYIPSSLAYGKEGYNGIKPDEILVFDMQIANVESQEAAMKRMQAQEDSMSKAAQQMPKTMPPAHK